MGEHGMSLVAGFCITGLNLQLCIYYMSFIFSSRIQPVNNLMKLHIIRVLFFDEHQIGTGDEQHSHTNLT